MHRTCSIADASFPQECMHLHIHRPRVQDQMTSSSCLGHIDTEVKFVPVEPSALWKAHSPRSRLATFVLSTKRNLRSSHHHRRTAPGEQFGDVHHESVQCLYDRLDPCLRETMTTLSQQDWHKNSYGLVSDCSQFEHNTC